MEEPPEDSRLMEKREELMVPPTGDGKPTLRIAHFLNPSSLSCTDNPLHTLSPPSLSSTASTSKTQTQKNPLNVSFNGWREPQKGWKIWVDHMYSLHKRVWEKAGICESIMGSVYSIRKDCELVIKVAEKWCPETNSFVFPFGEATVTLEDMMALGGYSVLGDSVLTPLLAGQALEETRKELLQARLELVRRRAKKADQAAWLKKFMKTDSTIEHEAFLSLWLSRFVFPSASGYGTIGTNVFPIAVLLAKGTKIALAPAVVASIYRDLSLLRKKMAKNDVSPLTLWAPLQLLQVWIWERFPSLGPQPNPVRDVDPLLARWHTAKKPNTGNVDLAMASSGKCFQWRPYFMAETHQLIHKLYGETEKWVSVRPDFVEVLKSFGCCMRVAELVGLDCIEQYFPHRVAMQFVMDQDVPGNVVFRSDGNWEIAWRNYSRPILDAKLYVPSRYFEAEVTTRYLEWWKNSNGTKGVVKEETDCDSNFPTKCTRKRKMADTLQSIPPGFPPKGTMETENKVCSDFPSVPPGFSSNMVSQSGNSDFPSVPLGFPSNVVSKTDDHFPSVPPGFPSNMISKTGNNDFPSVPPGFSSNIVSKMGNNDFPSIPLGFPSNMDSKNGNNDFPSVPPGFPSNMVSNTGNIDFPSVAPESPPGFPSNMVSETRNNDFPSTPPGFPPEIVSTLGDLESPTITPIVIVTEKRDFADKDTLSPTEIINEMKGAETRDPPSSTSENGELLSKDLMMSPDNRMGSDEDAVEGSERVVEHGNESGVGNTSNQGEGTVHSIEGRPWLEIEARIVKLEKLIAELKAKRFGNRLGS